MAGGTPQPAFPDPHDAGPDGLLAAGGKLTEDWLLAAYGQGIFPWFDDDDGPILWWSPDPRAVIEPGAMRVSRSLAKTIRRGDFVVTMDRDFHQVVAQCALTRRDSGTWITPRMLKAYQALHVAGYAHSVEVWAEESLVGGLYGVSLGEMFFGESMFSCANDASKVAFAALHAALAAWDFRCIDCQLPNPHLSSLGVIPVPRSAFLRLIADNQQQPTRRGAWQLPAHWQEAALQMQRSRQAG